MRLPDEPIGITANCIAPGVIATGRIMATVIPAASRATAIGPSWSRFRRLGTVEDCAKVVWFPATDLFRQCLQRLDPR
jgi:3-oxoacyl-[acyl-carrier protein] reductase